MEKFSDNIKKVILAGIGAVAVTAEKSKELLRQSNMKVSDIAGKVGYINVSYYTSIFRNQVGISPLQYREKANEI